MWKLLKDLAVIVLDETKILNCACILFLHVEQRCNNTIKIQYKYKYICFGLWI